MNTDRNDSGLPVACLWGATLDDPQELLNTARRHCQAIQAIIDQLTETKSNTELRLLSQRLQRLAFHAAPRSRDG
jgi:hypothetical protein